MPVKVAIRNVSKSYPFERERLVALEDVSLEIADGEFVAIVGPSGCGKSTLLHVLAGFERADRGAVEMDGRAASRPSPRAVLIAQRGSVFPWMTVRRNLLFGAVQSSADEREAMVRRYIDLVGLAGFEDRFPAQLSGGMLQRVEVARALMARPDVLYMDEPFGALDALTRVRMRGELRRILSRDRHTCLLVTHDVEEALHLADRVVVMTPRPGRIQCVLDVDAPHPRALSSAPLVALKQRILRELGLSDGEVERDTASPPQSHAPVARARALRAVPPASGGSAARADVVVIGGGPAGASAAAILAENGRSVVVLEREPFPRYHVGESLLPALWELWDRLGVSEQIEGAGFVEKQGIRFARREDPDDVVLLTAEYPEYFPRSYTYHVDRARFDALLLDNARRKGADVREGWSATDVWMEGDWAKGVLAGPNGEPPRAIAADVVVDATGRDCLLARKMGWRRPDPSLNKVAHYTQFASARKLTGATTTDVHTIDGGWLWFIPLAGDVVSVGAVLDAHRAGRLAGEPEAVFEAALAACPRVREQLVGARRTMPVQTISGISYINESFAGNGFALVGDASMFVDPIFSAGVTLAVRGGIYAADTILDAFQRRDFSAASLAPYEARIRPPMDRIFELIRHWYASQGRPGADDMIRRSRNLPWLRERLVVLLSGGYDKMDLESFALALREAS